MLYVHDAQGQQRGPFDAPTVLAMLQRGELDERALCCAAGETQWVSVREHPAIVALNAQSMGANTGDRSSWGAPAAAPWSVGGGGSTWGPTNSVPPSSGFGAPQASVQANVQASAPQVSTPRASAGAEEEAEEDAALGIPVEVVRPPSVVPGAMPSAAVAAPVAPPNKLDGARFTGATGATTTEHIEARRAAREQEGKARTKWVVAAMLGGGVLVVAGLAIVGWSRRRSTQAELQRASAAQGQVLRSELRGDQLEIDLTLGTSTEVRGVIESRVRCERGAQPPSTTAVARGERHERWICDVSEAPFGDAQRVRLSLGSPYGAAEVSATFTRPAMLAVQRDASTGVSTITGRGVAVSGTFDPRGGLTITLPARSTVWLGGAQHDASGEGPMRVAIPWDALFASTPTTQLFARDASLPIELRVSARGAPTLTTRLEAPTSIAREVLFRTWRQGQPVLLPGETATSAGRRTLVAQHGEVFGGPQQLRDVDLIAFDRESTQSKVCRYTIAPRERRTITLRRVDLSLSVYERRTARPVATRRFNAAWAECPAEFSETEVPATRFSDDAVRQWLEAFVR